MVVDICANPGRRSDDLAQEQVRTGVNRKRARNDCELYVQKECVDTSRWKTRNGMFGDCDRR